MRRIIWSTPAVTDLSNIRIGLLEGAGKPTALRVLRLIRAQAAQLESCPAAGAALDDHRRKLGVRGTPYVLLYRIDSGDVSVLRVHHQRHDWRPPE